MKELLSCTVCKKRAHPWCWDMTIIMAKVVKEYDWQCMECKTCITCSDSQDEEKMMFCDLCDRGYHSYCVGLHVSLRIYRFNIWFMPLHKICTI